MVSTISKKQQRCAEQAVAMERSFVIQAIRRHKNPRPLAESLDPHAEIFLLSKNIFRNSVPMLRVVFPRSNVVIAIIGMKLPKPGANTKLPVTIVRGAIVELHPGVAVQPPLAP